MRARLAGICAALVLLGGCSFTGLNSHPLPLTKGGGDGSITLTVYLDNAVNLVPNSEVKLDDVTVGSVRRIELKDWKAKLTIGLEPGTEVRADTTATIGQKSLLGAEYLALETPDDSTGSVLRSGATIPLERTSRYPETEEVLSAAALMLNGGGLEKVHTITHELNAALDGRTGTTRSLVRRLTSFVGTLDAQRDDIVRSLDRLDRVSRAVNRQDDDLERTLDEVPAGLRALDRERERLTKALDRATTFSVRARTLIRTSGEDLDANLESLRPTIKGLADAGDGLAGALGDLTFPYPMEGVLRITKGDYVNFFATIDLRTETLANGFLTGTPLDVLLPFVQSPNHPKSGVSKEDVPKSDGKPTPPPRRGLGGVLDLLFGGSS